MTNDLVINDFQRDRLQAAAFRAIEKSMNRIIDDSELLATLRCIIDENKMVVQNQSLDVSSLMLRLHATRMKRLPNTQFVYWPRLTSPILIKANGTQEYARSHKVSYDLEVKSDLFDRLCEIEHQLFKTDDALVVYWESSLPVGHCWQVLQSDDPKRLTFLMEYCPIHIYDEDTHHDAKITDILEASLRHSADEIYQLQRTWFPLSPVSGD